MNEDVCMWKVSSFLMYLELVDLGFLSSRACVKLYDHECYDVLIRKVILNFSLKHVN